MHIEEQLCKRLVDILKGIFTDAGLEIEVDGNWLVDEFGGFKDVDSTGAGSKVYVTVSPRSYPEYTAKTAEMDVKLEADIRHDDSFDGRKVNEAYAKLIDLLDLWHDNFGEMKKSLVLVGSRSRTADVDNSTVGLEPTTTTTIFDPCGLRLSGGQWDRTSDPKGWSLDQSFTIKGRINKT